MSAAEPYTARRTGVRICLLLFGLSLAVRLLFLVPVAVRDVPPLADEVGYLSRATAFREIARDIVRLRAPSAEDMKGAYGNGEWPPAHPLILGVGLFLFGEGPTSARLVVALLGALTTPLVFLLGARLTTRRGALAAAGIHVVYPSFVAYSHLLWSETTFIFFLLATAYCATLLAGSSPGSRQVAKAVLTGLLLGLCGLARASALPFLLAIPAWLAYAVKGSRRRIALPAVVLFACLLTLLPWELKLAQKTGRLVPLSTLAGFNLALGNNPWITPGLGSSFGQPTQMRHLDARLRERAERQGIGLDQAARRLAEETFRGDPAAALGRSLERLRMLWTADFFVLRHLVHATYPPLPPAVVVLLAILLCTSIVALVGLAVAGFVVSPALRLRSLLLVLVLAGTIPALVTIAMPRLGMPLLAVLLPAAGHGAVHLRRGAAHPALWVLCAGILALFCGSLATSLPLVAEYQLYASSYYSDLMDRADRVLGSESALMDHLAFRFTGAAEDLIRVEVLNDEDSSGVRLTAGQVWSTADQGRSFGLTAASLPGAGPLRTRLSSRRLGRSAVLEPVDRNAWRTWRQTGLEGIEVFWSGGRHSRPPARPSPAPAPRMSRTDPAGDEVRAANDSE